MSTLPKMSRLIKPTTDTQFHIDYAWWKREGRDLRSYLISQLPGDVRDAYAELGSETLIDAVDPITGEIRQVDGLLLRIRSIAKQRGDFINERTSIIDAVFRTFLVNDNEPLTAHQLSQRLNRDAQLILRTLSGGQVYQGIRPCVDVGRN